MTREDIIKMAREAGFAHSSFCRWSAYTDDLQRFAALVAAHEREACARVCDLAVRANSYQGSYQTVSDCAAAIRARGETK